MSAMDATNLTIETLKQMFAAGKRFDGRGLHEFRPFTLELGIAKTAEGSARIRLGKTEVLAGVKLAPGTPYPDSMDKGNLMVSGDLLPIASPRIQAGPPGFTAIELPRLVDRAIRESKMIDLKKLVIKEGEKVWTVMIDLYPINDDGNLIDAACIAAIAALKKAMVPELDENNMIDYDKPAKKKLPISDETAPISISFFKLGNAIILDPTREEEEACEARVTFGISKWNGQYMINSCQKNNVEHFTTPELDMMMDTLIPTFDKLNERLKSYL